MTRLNFFIDETGEFGFDKRSAKLYGISLVFHEQKNNIRQDVIKLENNLKTLGFTGMVHMGDLVTGHGDFEGMSIARRRKIYQALYRFSIKIEARYCTIIIDKHNFRNNKSLSQAINTEFRNLIEENLAYFLSFDRIKIYYDGGQKPLNKIIANTFLKFNNTIQESNFNHIEKKLFQVADMLTYVDKIIYKYNKRTKLTKTEQSFFSKKQIRITINGLKRHRMY